MSSIYILDWEAFCVVILVAAPLGRVDELNILQLISVSLSCVRVGTDLVSSVFIGCLRDAVSLLLFTRNTMIARY